MLFGESVLTVIHEDSAEKYKVTKNVPAAKGVRTMALDPDCNTVYLVTAQREAPAPGQRSTWFTAASS